MKLIQKILFVAGILLLSLPAEAEEGKPGHFIEERQGLFITDAQIERALKQYGSPEMARSREAFEAKLEKNARDWEKMFPVKEGGYSAAEFLAAAETSTYQSDMVTEAAAAFLCPSERNGRILREKLLLEIGIHKANGSWRELGIHQGERLSRYLYAYDAAVRNGLLTEEDRTVIKAELHQAARFLNAWTLESPVNYIYYGQTFCFNIKFFPICILGVAGMYFPEFEESAFWVEQAQEQVTRMMLQENFADGAYGEGSIHYWGPTTNGILLYITASRNLGVRDCMQDLTFRRYFSKWVWWRADLTATDGRKVAIGDAHRVADGSDELLRAAYLLEDHQLAYVFRMIHEGVNGGYLLSPLQLLTFDADFALERPEHLYKNYIWSGYGIFRSGWDIGDNFLMMKYGPTWAGRRSIEKYAVIPGHAHEDCMGLEMLWNGIPMFVDGGYRGVYADYDTYGGFWKATIAHNTVGLGNDWGYSRTDGRFDEHVRKHGKEFRYEKEQKTIGANDQKLMAFSDTEDMGYVSARAGTYEDVEHQRSVLWFRDNSVTIVYDELESPSKQRYEWYLNPAGKVLGSAEDMVTVGDGIARLDIVDIDGNPRTECIDADTEGTPDYYWPFHRDFSKEVRWDGDNARWWHYTMMVKSIHSADATYFTAMIPYSGTSPYKVSPWASGKCFSSDGDNIFVTARTSGKDVTANADFAVLREKDGNESYMMKDGCEFSIGDRTYLRAELKSTAWEGLYDPKTTGTVSLSAQRASFILAPDPWSDHLVLYNPKIEEGKEEPVPIAVSISFYTGKAPEKIVWERSNEKMPQFDRPEYDRMISEGNFLTGLKNYREIDSRLPRKEIPFSYDAGTGMVTVTLPEGFNHIVWK